MCVIISREADVLLPYGKLEIACDINKDGFGLSWVERGKIKTVRSLEKNNPKAIDKELKRLAHKKVFLHLRHATVGEITDENSHPFFPLETKELQVGLMHNGTLFKYKPLKGTESDTKVFSETFVRPLLLRCHAFSKDGVLEDAFFKSLMKNEIWGESVFLLFDNTGKSVVIGKEGKTFEGWWASNDYSFDIQHHRSSQRTPYTNTNTNYRDWYGGSAQTSTRGMNTSEPLPWADWSGLVKDEINVSTWEEDLKTLEAETELSGLFYEKRNSGMMEIRRVIRETQRTGNSIMPSPTGTVVNLGVARRTFLEQVGLKSYPDIAVLSADQFADLCKNHPKAMAELFVDLMAERITKDKV